MSILKLHLNVAVNVAVTNLLGSHFPCLRQAIIDMLVQVHLQVALFKFHNLETLSYPALQHLSTNMLCQLGPQTKNADDRLHAFPLLTTSVWHACEANPQTALHETGAPSHQQFYKGIETHTRFHLYHGRVPTASTGHAPIPHPQLRLQRHGSLSLEEMSAQLVD